MEKKTERQLVYVCKACNKMEGVDDTSTPVYRNVVVHTAEYVHTRCACICLPFFGRIASEFSCLTVRLLSVR